MEPACRGRALHTRATRALATTRLPGATNAFAVACRGYQGSGRPETESVSLLPLMKGANPPWRDTFYGSYDQHHYEPVANLRMIRTDTWKLVRNFRTGEDELYDLAEDPYELKNLAEDDSAQETKKTLAQRLDAWQRRLNDPVLAREA